MSIRIQEYGMVGTSPFRGGLLPIEAIRSYASGVRDLTEGAIRAVSGGSALANEVQRVRSVGTKADIEEGIRRFRSDFMKELKASANPDQWENQWSYAVDNRLGSYFPESTPGVDDREMNAYISRMKEEGLGEVRRMAQLEGIALARESWEKKMAWAGERGDDPEMVRSVDEGKGIFIPESNASDYLEHVRKRASLARAERESDQSPLMMEKSLKEGSHSLSKDENNSARLLERTERNVNALKSKYGEWMLDISLKGGFVEEGALENAEKAGLLTPKQARNYRDAVAREKEAVWTRRQPEADISDLCEWRRRVDERTQEEESTLMLELACSGLPRTEVSALAKRVQKTSLISEEMRRKYSASLTSLYHSGAWGAPGDKQALKEWRRSQDMVFNALSENPDDGGAEAKHVVDEERKRQVSSWVTYEDMGGEKKDR